MIDPGALGTLLIGLDRARREFDPVPAAPRRPSARHGGGRPVRSAVADALRTIATRLDDRRPASPHVAA